MISELNRNRHAVSLTDSSPGKIAYIIADDTFRCDKLTDAVWPHRLPLV